MIRIDQLDPNQGIHQCAYCGLKSFRVVRCNQCKEWYCFSEDDQSASNHILLHMIRTRHKQGAPLSIKTGPSRKIRKNGSSYGKEIPKFLDYDQDYLVREFRSLAMKDTPSMYTEGRKNMQLNRYFDVLPLDHSRVILDPYRSPGQTDYINANIVLLSSYFIATQAPTPETIGDFHAMLLQYDVELVVMLCKCLEQGREKCVKYWPDVELDFQPFFVVKNSSDTLGVQQLPNGIEARSFDIVANDRKKRIKLLLFSAWPDFGVPTHVDVVRFLVCSIRKLQGFNYRSPVVMHCSAGLGRTGTIMAIHNLTFKILQFLQTSLTCSFPFGSMYADNKTYWRTMSDNPMFTSIVNVRNTVKIIRIQRHPGSVQSESQYLFIYLYIESELAWWYQRPRSWSALPIL